MITGLSLSLVVSGTGYFVAYAAPAAPTASPSTPDYTDPSPDPAPPVDTSFSPDPDPAESELTLALEEAARTGERVEVTGETTASSITYAMPDGTAQVEATAGPARVQQPDGSWADIDTTLQVTPEGTLAPAVVPGDTTFSAGGDDLLASLSDGAGTSITMSWTGPLPEPVLDGDTATYPDVLPDVDLVLTATRLGFSQLLVLNSRPSAAVLEQLATIDIPVQTTGADISEGTGGELQVTDDATGDLLGTAAAPLMWDARTDPRTDQPVALRDVGLAVDDTSDGQPSDPTGDADATLTLTPDTAFLTDPATVYPVTIDPTQTLGALGDTFVQKSFSSNQGGSTELRAGTYNGGGDVARSLLRFDVTALKNRVVQSATLGLWEFHSWSCSPRWIDIREAGDFNAGTVTWNSQPSIGGIIANANAARGYNSSCAAGWVDFNMTGWAQTFADSRNNRPNVMPLALQVGDERDNFAWKKFNSGNAGSNVPTLYFTFDGNCDQYAGNRVCGSIRDKWNQQGGPSGWLGLPTNSETGINGGWYSHFQGGSIYASSNGNIGTHFVRGAIRDRWAGLGWETSYAGWPTTDEICGLRNGGCYNHFERGSIYFSPATGAHNVQGAIRDRWAQLGWETSPLGYPTGGETVTPNRPGAYSNFQNGAIYWSDATGPWDISGAFRTKWATTGAENGALGFPTSPQYGMAQPNHFHQYFERDAIMYLAAGAPSAYYVQGPIRAKYAAMDWERSYLGFPTSDPTADAGGTVSLFQGGALAWETSDSAVHDCTILGTLNDDVINGTVNADRICGRSGADFIDGGEGDDVIYADDGNDIVYAGSGADTVYGGQGGDEIYGQEGPDTIDGGGDSDLVAGGDMDDRLLGGAGDDSIVGGDGTDSLLGSAGADTLDGGPGNDTMDGGVDNDAMSGGSGTDSLTGGSGSNVMTGGYGDDTLTEAANGQSQCVTEPAGAVGCSGSMPNYEAAPQAVDDEADLVVQDGDQTAEIPGLNAQLQGESVQSPDLDTPTQNNFYQARAAGRASVCTGDIDYPHISQDPRAQDYTVNVHLVGRCNVLPSQHTVEGTLYRLRWYGKERLTSGSYQAGARFIARVNLNKRCTPDSRYVYRADGRFYALVGTTRWSVSYYNQTPRELRCTRR